MEEGGGKGGFYASNESTATLDVGFFVDNKSSNDGVATAGYGSSIRVDESTFTKSVSKNDGGACSVDGGAFSVDDGGNIEVGEVREKFYAIFKFWLLLLVFCGRCDRLHSQKTPFKFYRVRVLHGDCCCPGMVLNYSFFFNALAIHTLISCHLLSFDTLVVRKQYYISHVLLDNKSILN